MADTDLGELRRPARPIEQRIERIARWRAQGLAGGQADSTFPADATDAAVFASGGDTSVVTGGGAGGAKWEYDTFSLTSSTGNAFTLTAVPVEKSEVVRVNGLVLTRAEYTITSNILVFTDLAAVRLGIGSDTWTIALNYAYLDLASPSFSVPVTSTDWSYNGDAVLDGTIARLNEAVGSQSGSMVTVSTLGAGWSTISIAFTVDITAGGINGNGIAFGLLDSAEAETYIGGTVSGLGIGFGVDPGGSPLDGSPDCAIGWIDTESVYSGDGTGVYLGSRLGGTTTTESDSGTFFSNGTNDYEITFTVTTPGRASAVVKWDGTTVLSSTTDLYVPATPRIIIAASSGSNHQHAYVTDVAVTTDGSDPVIAVPGGTYTPPTPPATPGTHVLRYQRPDTTGYTTLDVAAGGTFTLDQDTDYAITASTPVDSNYVRLVGGRNLDIYGVIFDFDPAVPTGSYDSGRRGLHIKDGPNPNLKRVIYIEGLYLRSGYFSDGIQVALRHENDVTLIVQAMRADAYGWGQRSGVHSDLIQFYGGPLNFFGDCITGTYLTYQGIFMRPADGRPLPSGADKEDWQLSRVNLESGDGPSGGAHYLLWDDQPAWTGLTLDEVYITGASGYDVTDGNANMPATGLFQNATPSGGDWAPSSWWVGDTYTSPGYV